LVITRNEESRTVLRELGVPTELGTDTAWTFEPHPAEFGQKALREIGWDGRTPVLVVCPINPFEWPVRASVTKLALHGLTGAYKDSHYRSVYFHNAGPEADRALEHYLSAIANAVRAFRQQQHVFVILVATERLDARPARRISEKLGGVRSEEHTSELQSLRHLVCRLLLEKKKKKNYNSVVPSTTVTDNQPATNEVRTTKIN